MAKNEPRDELDLENLTELEVTCGYHTQEELDAEIAAMHSDTDSVWRVSEAMGCIWWCHLPLISGYGAHEVKAEQYKMLEFIFGPNTKLKLINQMSACGEKNPMIGEKLVEYAKLHGYEKELPDDLREGLA